MEREHEAVVRDYLAVWEDGDLDRLEDIFGERVTVHGPRRKPIDRTGRIVEFWGEDDTLGLCLQLGLIDPAGLPADIVGDYPERHHW